MKLEGIHHITAITADAPRIVDFYTRVLGQRLVKKTVNQDDPTVYHLFYADEHRSPGADLTFFEYPGIERGQAGAGMVRADVKTPPTSIQSSIPRNVTITAERDCPRCASYALRDRTDGGAPAGRLPQSISRLLLSIA